MIILQKSKKGNLLIFISLSLILRQYPYVHCYVKIDSKIEFKRIIFVNKICFFIHKIGRRDFFSFFENYDRDFRTFGIRIAKIRLQIRTHLPQNRLYRVWNGLTPPYTASTTATTKNLKKQHQNMINVGLCSQISDKWVNIWCRKTFIRLYTCLNSQNTTKMLIF